jgi:hypothetical protein
VRADEQKRKQRAKYRSRSMEFAEWKNQTVIQSTFHLAPRFQQFGIFDLPTYGLAFHHEQWPFPRLITLIAEYPSWWSIIG